MLPRPNRMKRNLSHGHSRPVSRLFMAALVIAVMFDGSSIVEAQQSSRVAADLKASRRATASKPAPQRKRASSRRPAARSTNAPPRTPPRPLWTSPVGAADLANDIGAALAQHTRNGQWGAIVVSLSRRDTLFARNADALMLPASTMKMYTAAAALDHFGPDYAFKTPVLRDGQVTPDGILNGNLYLRGVGDPSLSSRFWHDVQPTDVLAKQIVDAGIKRVRGDIVGDATEFDDQLVPAGWKTSYLGAAYAARVSALSLAENLVWVVVKPNGKSVSVSLEPATTSIPVESSVRLTNGTRGRISAVRRSDGTIAVRGTIGSRSGPLKYSLVVDNPPLFAAGALRASLRAAGVVVDGPARIGTAPSGAAEVAAVGSPPLGQIIGEMDRESINVVAELLFKATGHATTNQVGSAATGLANLRDFLSRKVGASASAVDVADGSGLSLLDRFSPRSMVQLLGYVHQADWGPVFHASLPVEGESGTLRRRARGTPARGNLHAKTGTTNTVAALGGYVTAKNGEVLAFSLIYNGTDRGNAMAAMDRIGATMAEFMRQ
jgi:D-alanyl-D-alanine carboxypeptidase/D-alanyl-D-alanine-endopeptidase (penicillin-binding protein 4)